MQKLEAKPESKSRQVGWGKSRQTRQKSEQTARTSGAGRFFSICFEKRGQVKRQGYKLHEWTIGGALLFRSYAFGIFLRPQLFGSHANALKTR
jgi:hypothetical protein